MNVQEYEVLIDKVVVGSGMTLDIATVLLKALFEERHDDTYLTISIRKISSNASNDGGRELVR